MTAPPGASPAVVPEPEPLRIFLVAAEESGDRLGAALMRALRGRTQGQIAFAGVGGEEMAREGLASLYPIDGFSIIGFSAIPRRLPGLLKQLRDTVRGALAMRPHVLVIIDSPGFTLWVARWVRRAAPAIRIVDYVSPSVWAWRPWRAASMRRYIDHVLALLPFEPAVHKRLHGPPCTYVGHPLTERAHALRPDAQEQRRRDETPPLVVVMPGSRTGEIHRMLPCFAETIARVTVEFGAIEVVVPTVPHLQAAVEAAVATWPVPARVVVAQAEKDAAFRAARAALVKSGTGTLELAVAGVPMVAAYKVSALEALVARRMIKVPSIVLANLVLGENAVPEFIQEDCTAERLAAALIPLLGDGPQRGAQLQAFARLDEIMQIGQTAPSERAAAVVLDVAAGS